MIYNLNEFDVKIIKVKVLDNGIHHYDEWDKEYEQLINDGYIYLDLKHQWEPNRNCTAIGIFIKQKTEGEINK